jgi:chromosome segregation ATPase
MVNSRELAEQAFSLLQDALKDSEARAAELDAELRKERAPRNSAEEQALVLEHRLESIEAEREHWKREAAQLAEILENERAKLRKVKKKLEIAESGPNAVDKKEVNFWREKADEFDAEKKEYKQRIAALRKELNARPEQGDAIDPDVLHQLEAARHEATELKAAMARLKAGAETDIARLKSGAETDIARLKTEAEQLRSAAGRHEAATAGLKGAAADAEKARLHAENLVRERDSRLAEQTARIAALGAEIAELKGKLAGNAGALSQLEARIGERDTEIARQKAAAETLRRQADELKSANDRLSSDFADRTSEIDEIRRRFDSARGEVAERDRMLAERDRRISELAEVARLAEEEKRSIRDQIAGLEDELKEEKECTVNLSQIANERREEITRLSEKLDEALERFEEAKWKLERAGWFERLVTRRRKLIGSLLETIRSKQKANTALKAGLDGLRKFKAKSEQQQQKLLVRIEELTAQVKEAREKSGGNAAGKEAGEKLRKAEEKITSLDTRLEAQGKLIETLEKDLANARASRQSAENQAREIAELKSALEKKDASIERLKADLDLQQKQLGKLRGTESETQRLKAVQERDHDLIGELEKEIKDLNETVNRQREEIERQKQAADANAPATPDTGAQTSAEIRKRDAQISDLKRANKDHEKEIKQLKEAVAGWQKKYEFLSAEPPSAYQATVPPAKQPVN